MKSTDLTMIPVNALACVYVFEVPKTEAKKGLIFIFNTLVEIKSVCTQLGMGNHVLISVKCPLCDRCSPS